MQCHEYAIFPSLYGLTWSMLFEVRAQGISFQLTADLDEHVMCGSANYMEIHVLSTLAYENKKEKR